MTVRRTQNSGIPAQPQAAEIQDGTRNTTMFGNTAKGEAPLAKDSFKTAKESFRSTSGLKMETEVTDKSKSVTARGLTPNWNEVTVEGLKAQDAVDFMDYTDDSCVKK